MVVFNTRQELGFDKDDFEGFIIRKDDRPILQLHLYREFYTVFWLGRTTASKLWQCLRDVATELRTRLDLPLNAGTARYVIEAEVRHLRFVLEPTNQKDQSESEVHTDFLKAKEHSIVFARYDMEGETPVILWANLTAGEQVEIGFSSQRALPDAIMTFVRETSIAKLDTDELKQISSGIAKQIK